MMAKKMVNVIGDEVLEQIPKAIDIAVDVGLDMVAKETADITKNTISTMNLIWRNGLLDSVKITEPSDKKRLIECINYGIDLEHGHFIGKNEVTDTLVQWAMDKLPRPHGFISVVRSGGYYVKPKGFGLASVNEAETRIPYIYKLVLEEQMKMLKGMKG